MNPEDFIDRIKRIRDWDRESLGPDFILEAYDFEVDKFLKFLKFKKEEKKKVTMSELAALSHLSVRTRNALLRAGIKSKEQVMDMGDIELRNLRHIGTKGLIEIEQWIFGKPKVNTLAAYEELSNA